MDAEDREARRGAAANRRVATDHAVAPIFRRWNSRIVLSADAARAALRGACCKPQSETDHAKVTISSAANWKLGGDLEAIAFRSGWCSYSKVAIAHAVFARWFALAHDRVGSQAEAIACLRGETGTLRQEKAHDKFVL